MRYTVTNKIAARTGMKEITEMRNIRDTSVMSSIQLKPSDIVLTKNKVANMKVVRRIREEGFKVGYDAIIVTDGVTLLRADRKLATIAKIAKAEMPAKEYNDLSEAVEGLRQTIIPEAGVEKESYYVVDGISRLLGLKMSHQAVEEKRKVRMEYDKKNHMLYQTTDTYLYVNETSLRKTAERKFYGWDIINFLSLYKETDKVYFARLIRFLYGRAVKTITKSELFEATHEIIGLLYPTLHMNEEEYKQLDFMMLVDMDENCERPCPGQYTVKTDIYNNVWNTAVRKGISTADSGKYLVDFNNLVSEYTNKTVLAGTGVEARFFSRDILPLISSNGIGGVQSAKGKRWKSFLEDVRNEIDKALDEKRVEYKKTLAV